MNLKLQQRKRNVILFFLFFNYSTKKIDLMYLKLQEPYTTLKKKGLIHLKL